jgi:formylglycine-generating enzyme required for sulfatase activity
MATKLRCALIFVLFVLGSALCAYAQLRPEVTVKPKPKKPPAVKPAQIIVETSPNAEVYLDDQFVGWASPQGRLVIGSPKPGERALRVSLAGKRDYEMKVTVIAGQVANVVASLAELPEIAIPSPTGTKGLLTGVGARTHDELVALAHRTDRDYFEFNLGRIGTRQKIGTVLIELRGTDPKKNQFTVNLYFDDKRTERRDKAINELVYFYVQGASSALELVVNKLGRDSISGYISTPKGFFPNTPNVLTPRSGQGEAEKVLPPGAVRENPEDGLKYVWIPPGSFMMGCSPGDSECEPDEKPAHRVSITKGFWLGQTEVTVGAYKRFASAAGTDIPSAPDFNPGWGNEAMPIVDVSWDDAQAFCAWAEARLPSEAEWEYAVRGGSAEARYGPLDEIAWYPGNSRATTHEVGQRRANAFGLFDMLGNVWEWVSDWYDYSYYRASPDRDPQGPGSGNSRVVRGGSWLVDPKCARTSNRDANAPAVPENFHNGFRCAREVMP